MKRLDLVVPVVALALLAAPVGAQERDPAPDACDEPCFTPFSTAPSLLNRQEVGERLDREYPAELRSDGVGGTTLVWLLVDDEGSVTRVSTHRSSGVPALDDVAIEVARDMRFSPAMHDGRPVTVWIQLPIQFEPSAG